MDLFTHGRAAQIQQESPLANRMRPRTLDEYVGQAHILGPGRLLRRAIQADQLSSLIFYGPPGTGKTTLAMVIANSTRSHFITINAVLAGVKEIREAIATAQERRDLYGQRTTLFVDEVHRWNKAQQDALLPWVENGTIILIGATTENPYFEVNKALVSRSRIFQLKSLTEEDLTQIARQALADEERGYGKLNVHLDDDALAHLVDVANGDARGVLNALELAVETTPAEDSGESEAASGRIHITLEVAEESIQRRAVLYDKEGDVHYDTISAFIKSVRGSDPDAAMYWLAKMDYAGEDPRFLFRRMAILAGEDIGMADPNAITVVLSCWQAFERIGLPEGRFPLALAALYLSTAPKSNSAFAFFDARGSVEKEQEAEVPNHLRDANRDKEGFGHGAGYLYPHAYRDHWVAQQYLPAALQGKLFYQPSDQGYERGIREQVARRREEQIAGMLEGNQGLLGDWRLEMGEIYTTSPTNKARDAWLQRTISNSGRNLGQQRDKLFELTAVQRHHLILDINAGSGLLTWEAVRRAPEGGVWALTADPQAGEALRQMAERLPEMERPSILIGALSELDYLLNLRGEADLKFDRILARNLFTDYRLPITDYDEMGRLRDWLLPDGRLCLIQTVPRHGQRLYRLVEWGEQTKLRDKVAMAEEAIYHDETDPLVNWDEKALESALTAVGFTPLHMQLETETSQRQITETHLARWFGEGEGERVGYGRRLQAGGLSKKEVAQVQTLYRQQLLGRVVEWGTAVLFLVVECDGFSRHNDG
ncbi:MAG TPA: AAA family ATPase [Chloroflexota bacterium]|nr:AAA family ATPase [Chloroflexota bacterium]